MQYADIAIKTTLKLLINAPILNIECIDVLK